MRKSTLFVLAALVPLAACQLPFASAARKVAVPAPQPITNDLSAAYATACRAAIAAEVGKSLDEVSLINALPEGRAIVVRANVAGAVAPWACVTSPEGAISQVYFDGSEGAL